MEEFRVSIDTLTNNRLTLEQYFILYCVNHNYERMLIEYSFKVSKISTEVYSKLIEFNLLSIKDLSNITFDSLKLTEVGEKLFVKQGSNIKEDFLNLFNELKTTYPAFVLNDQGKPRRLLSDLERCKKLYMNTIFINGNLDIDLHRKMLKIIKIYSVETGKYIQLLATFLQKRVWEQYLEDIDKNIDLTVTKNNFDAI